VTQDPTWTDIATAIASIVSASAIIAVFAAAIFAGRQVREAQTTRFTQMESEVSKRWDEPAMTRARYLARRYSLDKFANKVWRLRQRRAFRYYEMQLEPNFLEDLALLEKRGGISFEWIYESMGALIPSSWERWGRFATLIEQRTGATGTYEHFRELAKRCETTDAAAGRAGGPSRFLPRFGLLLGRWYVGIGRRI
jgi:hypothetical protein